MPKIIILKQLIFSKPLQVSIPRNILKVLSPSTRILLLCMKIWAKLIWLRNMIKNHRLFESELYKNLTLPYLFIQIRKGLCFIKLCFIFSYWSEPQVQLRVFVLLLRFYQLMFSADRMSRRIFLQYPLRS